MNFLYFSAEDVVKHITSIKSKEDCPADAYAQIEDGNGYRKLKFELTNILYPQGKCCRAVIPKNALDFSFIKMYFLVFKPFLVEGFQVFLSNQESTNELKLNNFNTHGVELKALNSTGFSRYNVKLREEKHLGIVHIEHIFKLHLSRTITSHRDETTFIKPMIDDLGKCSHFTILAGFP